MFRLFQQQQPATAISLATFLQTALVFAVLSVQAQDSLHSACETRGGQGPGTCVAIYECRDPQPTGLPICGFDRTTPIVCCPNRHVGSAVSRPPSRPPGSLGFEGGTSGGGGGGSLGNRIDSIGRSISERKCAEYSKPVTTNVSALLLTAQASTVSHAVPSCDYTKVQLIVGGEQTQPGEFPHMVALGYGTVPYKFNCGGTLISEQYVLTAAHCTRTSGYDNPVVARLADHDLYSENDNAKPEDVRIVEVIQHPEYRPPRKYHDLALLRLERPVVLREDLRPACLPSRNNKDPSKAIATGWGQINYEGSETVTTASSDDYVTEAEDPSPVLLKVVLPLVDHTSCARLWQSTVNVMPNRLPKGIDPETMLCAGELAGGRDTCLGDSGGPLTVASQDNHCVHRILGVTSFGKYCGQRNSPGIYTRIQYYVPWIESVVWPRG